MPSINIHLPSDGTRTKETQHRSVLRRNAPHKAESSKARKAHFEIDMKRACVPDEPLSRNRKRSNDGNITQNIEAQLEQRVAVLKEDFGSNIDRAATNLKSDLAALFSNAHDDCDTLQEAEDHLNSKFSDEALDLGASIHPAGSGIVSLELRLHEYRMEIRIKTDELEKLWQEYSVVQRELVCIAVEVLGRDVIMDANGVPEALGKVINEAQVAHEQHDNRRNVELLQVEALQIAVEDLVDKAIQQSTQNLHDFQRRRHKQIQAVQAALQELDFV